MRVVVEQVRQRLDVGEVVDADDVDVGAGREQSAEVVAADAAEAVDTNPNGHGGALPGAPDRARRGLRMIDDQRRTPSYLGSHPRGYPQVAPTRPWPGVRRRASRGSGSPRCRGSRDRSARLSAIASSRRIRPATASLVIGGSASWPSSSRLACLCLSRSSPACRRWSGMSSPRISIARSTRRARGDGGARRPAQVGVVEVRQPVGGGADLAPHPALLPREHGVVGAEPGEHGADRVAVADHDPVDAADLASLRRRCRAGGRRRRGPARPPVRGR